MKLKEAPIRSLVRLNEKHDCGRPYVVLMELPGNEFLMREPTSRLPLVFSRDIDVEVLEEKYMPFGFGGAEA